MAAKDNIRVITASEDDGEFVSLIDRGADVDADLKELSKEDKTIKTQIKEVVEKLLEHDEVSIRIKGNEATALVTAAETYTLKPVPALRKDILTLIEEGVLTGVIERKQQLVVSPENIERAADILKKAGVTGAEVTENFSINAEGFRKFKKEFADKEFVNKLDNSVTLDTTFRVKYERNSEASE